MPRPGRRFALALVSVVVAGCTSSNPIPTAEAAAPVPASRAAQSPGERGPIRLAGTVEAVRSRTVAAPRLSGTITPMIITSMAGPGSRVNPGDLIIEFDRQEQERLAFDKRAELVDLDGQIVKRKLEQAAAEAKDQTELTAAENDVARAKLEVRKNELIARVSAEKNTLALEQANARFEQLRTTFALKRKAAAADLRILEIRRDRAERALAYAERNADLMQVNAPFAGLVVIKSVYRGNAFVQIVEGDEVRPGMPVMDIVDTSAMLVRAKVNQADAELVRPGQATIVRLDAFPELTFKGRVEQITPLAVGGQYSRLIRSFTATVSIEGTHEQLLPDLTASVEILPDAAPPTATARRQP